ncbi:Glyoxalase/bleomycin resistance protein/dioxygenase [Mycolicibacterium rhodesiae JS60]|nr:Glyoxalase/bleomycin resistance protein/dioxygenase [Mycolicibacterium rhodesiae JS60]
MITNISLVSVFVRDIDESLAFYTDILGFEAKDDLQLGPDFRWCTVVHPNQPELQVHLTTPSKPLSDDCCATYEQLKAKGVEFLQAPEERPYGVEALMRDNSGNWMVLVEAREYAQEDFDGFAEATATS